MANSFSELTRIFYQLCINVALYKINSYCFVLIVMLPQPFNHNFFSSFVVFFHFSARHVCQGFSMNMARSCIFLRGEKVLVGQCAAQKFLFLDLNPITKMLYQWLVRTSTVSQWDSHTSKNEIPSRICLQLSVAQLKANNCMALNDWVVKLMHNFGDASI